MSEFHEVSRRARLADIAVFDDVAVPTLYSAPEVELDGVQHQLDLLAVGYLFRHRTDVYVNMALDFIVKAVEYEDSTTYIRRTPIGSARYFEGNLDLWSIANVKTLERISC